MINIKIYDILKDTFEYNGQFFNIQILGDEIFIRDGIIMLNNNTKLSEKYDIENIVEYEIFKKGE